MVADGRLDARKACDTLPFPRRVLRAARVIVHVLEGLAITSFVFPRIHAERRRAITQRWSERLLELLAVHAKMRGQLAAIEGNVLIVANHLSWLDIFVLMAQQPARFIAKAELGTWPVVGRLMRQGGTLFLTRERRRDMRRVNDHTVQALAAGDIVAVFPEGMTSDGSAVLPFHGSLLQPIIDSGGDVLPVAIRYLDAQGTRSSVASYVGDETFPTSFWRTCGARRIVAELIATPRVPAHGRHRRELARQAQAAIRAALDAPALETAPETPVDRRSDTR